MSKRLPVAKDGQPRGSTFVRRALASSSLTECASPHPCSLSGAPGVAYATGGITADLRDAAREGTSPPLSHRPSTVAGSLALVMVATRLRRSPVFGSDGIVRPFLPNVKPLPSGKCIATIPLLTTFPTCFIIFLGSEAGKEKMRARPGGDLGDTADRHG